VREAVRDDVGDASSRVCSAPAVADGVTTGVRREEDDEIEGLRTAVVLDEMDEVIDARDTWRRGGSDGGVAGTPYEFDIGVKYAEAARGAARRLVVGVFSAVAG
jgi:hypothetical protein